MSENTCRIATLLNTARDALTASRPIDENDLSAAGAALEQAAADVPAHLPGVGTLLSLVLEALESAYVGTLDRDEAVAAAERALSATLAQIEPADQHSESGADPSIDSAGAALWTLLQRSPELSPFETGSAAARPAAAVPHAADRLATLIGLSPADSAELANLAAWLLEHAEAPALDRGVREAAEHAHALICSVLDAEADDAQEALDRAAEIIGGIAEPSDGHPTSESPIRESEGEDHIDDEPACLQFVGDAGLLAEFVAEALDHIDSAEAGMLAVETDPGDVEAVNAVFRAFHTIKGAAGFLGLAPIQELAHWAESLLDRVRQGEIQLTGACADLALASSDALKQMLHDLDGWQDGPLPDPPPRFDELLSQLTAPDPTISAADGPPSSPITAAAQAAEPDPSRKPGSSQVAAAVRVSTGRLDSLINMVGELVIANAMLAQDEELRERSGQDVVRKIDQISKITRELQDVSMSLRMVPLSGTFQRMARLVRDLARKSGKQVELVTEGEDTEIDRNMVEAINDPLLHMVRNAVDHGIETPDERREAGKPESGTVALRAYHAAGSVVIELQDDGRGLDRDRIHAKAVRNGVIADGAQLSDEEVHRLIFAAGLSTAEQVTDVSGRGVGMDVVRRNIEAMRGRIDISSALGEGTTFTVRVPLTLAIIDGMLLRVGGERYILPTISILRSVRPEPGSVSTVSGRGEMIDLQGRLLPVLRLHEILGIGGATTEVTDGLVVVTEGNGATAALLVDELLGQQQIVIKSLGEGLGDVPCVSGAAILGDGSVGLILDVDGLLALARSGEVSATSEQAAQIA